MSHQFYDTNPYTSGATSTPQKTLKLRICGLPLSVADSAVHELFGKLDVILTSKILTEKIRHPITKCMTNILNGTRFMHIEPLPTGKHLLRINYCGECKLFHYGQPKQTTICFVQTAGNPIIIGLRVQMMLVVRCKRHLAIHGHEHLTAFCGAQDFLSYFYPCELEIFDV